MPDPRSLSSRQKAAIMVAIMLGLFLAALDQTIVGTALPRIVTDLAGNNLYTWVVTVYLLTSTVTVPIYGKLSDVYGRRPLLLIGIAVFLVGSALSGLSQSMGELIIFRGLQGFGAGAIFPIALSVIGDLFSPAERGRYQGLFGAVFGLSFIIGPFLGGAGGVAPWDLTDALDRGDTPAALEALARLSGPGERHPLVILSSLHRHFAAMLRLDGSGIRSEQEAAAAVGMGPYPAKKALAQAGRLGSANIARAVNLLADADLDLRGVKDLPDNLVLEVLVARLSRLRPATTRSRSR